MLRSLIAVAALAAPLVALAVTPTEIASKAAASVKRSAKWDRIEVQRATPADYALIVWYKRMPTNHAEVERDTKTVARAMLKELSAAKLLPSQAPLFVFVRGRMPERGETGKELVRVFGVTHYDSTSDQLVFQRNK